MSTSQKRDTFYCMSKGHIQAKQETVIQISSKGREQISFFLFATPFVLLQWQHCGLCKVMKHKVRHFLQAHFLVGTLIKQEIIETFRKDNLRVHSALWQLCNCFSRLSSLCIRSLNLPALGRLVQLPKCCQAHPSPGLELLPTVLPHVPEAENFQTTEEKQ